MLPPPDPPARPDSGDTPARFEVSLIVYDPLILATCPHNSDAILALASSLKDRKIRVRSVCKSARPKLDASGHSRRPASHPAGKGAEKTPGHPGADARSICLPGLAGRCRLHLQADRMCSFVLAAST